MKKLLLATTCLCLAVSSASAADLPARTYTKAPALVAAPSWTGFYLSGGAGYGQMESDQYATVNGARAAYDQRLGGTGYFGVVGGGFDYQFAPLWVAGVFGDAHFGDINGSIINDGLFPFGAGRLKNETNWAIGARLGYLVTPNVLSYVNAGYSNARFSGSNLVNNTGGATTFSTNSFNRDGWFVGGGVEHSLNFFGIGGPGWFVKTEYRLAEYERGDVNILSSGTPTTSGVSVKPYVQTVSTQLVYRFNTGNGLLNPAPLYTKAPVTAPANWNGFYLGGGGGYGLMSSTEHQVNGVGTPITADVKYGGRGYFGTVSGGYDWQFAPAWVAGVFADAQFGDIHGTLTGRSTQFSGDLKNDVNWAVGARLGYLVAPNVLSYVNAGYTNASFKSGALAQYNFPPVATFNSFNRSGWFLGGGVEHAFNFFGLGGPNWFAKTEYRVADYDRGNVAFFGVAPGSISTKQYIQTVSTQLIYRFNWGGPVVAKY